MRRSLLLLVPALAIVAVACTTSSAQPDDATDTAASIVEAVDASLEGAPPEAGLVVPEGCELEQTFDDYGFAVEIVVCPDEPSTPPTTVVVALEDYLGSSDARRLTVAIRNAVVIDAGCEADSVIALETALATAPQEVRIRLAPITAELAAATLVCGERWSEWERHMESAAAHLEELVRFLQTEEASG